MIFFGPTTRRFIQRAKTRRRESAHEMNGVKTKHFSFRSRQAAGDSAAPVQAGGLCENKTPCVPTTGSSGGSGRSPMAGERRGLRRSGSRGDAQPGPRSAPGAALPAMPL